MNTKSVFYSCFIIFLYATKNQISAHSKSNTKQPLLRNREQGAQDQSLYSSSGEMEPSA